MIKLLDEIIPNIDNGTLETYCIVVVDKYWSEENILIFVTNIDNNFGCIFRKVPCYFLKNIVNLSLRCLCIGHSPKKAIIFKIKLEQD